MAAEQDRSPPAAPPPACVEAPIPPQSRAQQLDVSDLDEEDLKALAEVSSKGYYHARPKSEAAPTPQRLDAPPAEAAVTGKRTDFDEFQRKWDKFDEEGELRSDGAAARTSAAPPRLQAGPPPPVAADEGVVAQLMAMGFGREESRAAAVACGNRADTAIDVLLGGLGAAPAAPAPAPARRRAPAEPDAQKVALLLEMGIAEDVARQALADTGNDLERAVDLACGLVDSPPPTSAPQPAPPPPPRPPESPASRLRRARAVLEEAEGAVAAMEASLDSAEGQLGKRLRSLEEAVTEASCGLDAVDVTSDTSLREARRVELARCSALEARIAGLRRNVQGAVGEDSPALANAQGVLAVGAADGAPLPAASPAVAAGAAASLAPTAEDEEAARSAAASRDRLALAEARRLEGNAAFKEADYATAALRYAEALELDGDNVAILSNLAAAEIKLGAFDEAVAHATAANELSGGFSAKALFRQGQALEGLGRAEEAVAAYQAALRIEPDDRAVRQRLEECQQALRKPTPADPGPVPAAPAANYQTAEAAAAPLGTPAAAAAAE